MAQILELLQGLKDGGLVLPPAQVVQEDRAMDTGGNEELGDEFDAIEDDVDAADVAVDDSDSKAANNDDAGGTESVEDVDKRLETAKALAETDNLLSQVAGDSAATDVISEIYDRVELAGEQQSLLDSDVKVC